jgi:uracil-DNA glycosylase
MIQFNDTMNSLESLLNSTSRCQACPLIVENAALDIPFVPILPKPNAKIIFIGRDPSPRTATIIGKRSGKSVFINEIFNIVDSAGVCEREIYITDLLKCHWRTSVGKPISGTEKRSTKVDSNYATTCMHKWLFQEIQILKPKLIIIFGEELYQIMRKLIINPEPPPLKLSASLDKSVIDSEYWFVKNGCFTLEIDKEKYSMIPLRHPGNSYRLPKNKKTDRRWEFYKSSREILISKMHCVCNTQ